MAEIGFLEAVLEAVNRWRPGSDTKLKKLKDLLLDHGHLGSYSRTIVFTRYIDTMNYLADELGKDGSFEIFTVDGTLNDKARAERIRAFQHAGRALLIATDAISEGLNLQFAANQLVHYELPWNPNRLEQRNGRIDRFKQPEREVRIRTLINERSFDLVVFRKLIQKAQRIREAYGFLPPYFSDEKYTEDLVSELISESLTKQRLLQPGLFDQEDGDGISEEDRAVADKMRAESFYGQTSFNLPDVEMRLKTSQDTIGSPAEVERLVVDAFRHLDWRVDDHKNGTYSIVRVGATPIPGIADDLGRITFDADVGAVDPDVNHLDVANPTVTKLLNYVKRQSYLSFKNARTAVVTKQLPVGSQAHAVYHVRARFTVGESISGQQLIEALIPIGINLATSQVAPQEQTLSFLTAEEGPTTVSPVLRQNLINKAHGLPNLDTLIGGAIRDEADRLREERLQLRTRLEETYPSQSAWLQGIDEIAPAAHDVLALTVILARRD